MIPLRPMRCDSPSLMPDPPSRRRTPSARNTNRSRCAHPLVGRSKPAALAEGHGANACSCVLLACECTENRARLQFPVAGACFDQLLQAAPNALHLADTRIEIRQARFGPRLDASHAAFTVGRKRQ